MTERSAAEQFQDFLSDEAWETLFTPAHLDHFAPKRGETDDPIPTLEVHYWKQGARKVAVMRLAIDGWNDWDRRMAVMRASGQTWGEQGWQVLALRLASAAWIREFTEEEHAARQGRSLDTYADRREIMMVAGMTLTRRTALASAEVLRDKAGRIRAVRPWQVWTAQTQPALHITMQLLEAAWEGYARQLLGSQEDPP